MSMQHLFTLEGQAALARTMRARPLVTFDFDGTLAPIVARPDDARVPAELAQRLSLLASRLTVAVITGRRVADVRERLGFTPHHVFGNHGAEEGVDDSVALDAALLARALDPLREQVGTQAAALAGAEVEVEDKGLSIALHYRRSRRPDVAQAVIEALTASLPATLHVFGGKMVVNAIARHAPDKADAVRRLQQRYGSDSVFFAGDDANDEPVFVAAPDHWLTVRIGREAGSRARWYLDGVQEMVPLVDRMLAQLPTAAAG